MLDVRQPYGFALATAVLGAALTYGYLRMNEDDSPELRKLFFKVAAAGAVAASVLSHVLLREGAPLGTPPVSVSAPSVAVNPAAFGIQRMYGFGA